MVKYTADITSANPFESFAPSREDAPVKWFVDGATYMAGVADALETAKEEIFITDWMLVISSCLFSCLSALKSIQSCLQSLTAALTS